MHNMQRAEGGALMPSQRDEVWVSDMGMLREKLEAAGAMLRPKQGSEFSDFGGVPVRTDQRVPEGVWALVPAGGTLLSPDTKVGAIDAGHRDTAATFAFALQQVRESQLSGFYVPPTNQKEIS